MNAHTNSLSSPRQSWLSLIGWLAAAHLAGAVGGIASAGAPAFYAVLVKPSFAPPAGVFGPAWLTLYTLMGVAAWLVWKERGRLVFIAMVRTAITLFVLQLAINALWSWLFFGWHQGALAFVCILVLIALVAATTWAFWKVRPLAGALLLPYLAWLVFAAALNYSVWQANPALLG